MRKLSALVDSLSDKVLSDHDAVVRAAIREGYVVWDVLRVARAARVAHGDRHLLKFFLHSEDTD